MKQVNSQNLSSIYFRRAQDNYILLQLENESLNLALSYSICEDAFLSLLYKYQIEINELDEIFELLKHFYHLKDFEPYVYYLKKLSEKVETQMYKTYSLNFEKLKLFITYCGLELDSYSICKKNKLHNQLLNL